MSFAVDLHTHTRFGSNCSYMEPRQLVQRAREIGLDGVCITEHNAAWEEEALRALAEESGLCLLGGIEVSSEVGDVLVFGVKDSLLPGRRIADLRRLVDEAGGVMIAAHPFRWYSLPGAILDEEEAAGRAVFRMVDAVEVFNGASPRGEVEFGCRVLKRLGLAGVGGSDSHAPHSVGRCYTEFEREIGSVEELVAEIKGGRFRAVYPGLSLVL
ncbi:MAG: PHP domain-containing protein [Chloroflexota bacterium]|nr:PHP domain-containing protein [Chloroflexota bacterium]